MSDDDQSNLLGICIPTYNRRLYLRTCLNSIIREFSSFNFPIYISDNASDDGTEEDIASLKEKYGNITYVRNHANIGPYQNILNVSSMANTDYIWLMGDDDAIRENSVCEIVKHLRNDYDFMILNSTSYDENLKEIKLDKIVECRSDKLYAQGSHNRLLYNLRKQSYHGYMSSMIIRRTLLSELIKEFRNAQFSLYNNMWLPLAIFYEAIRDKKGIFLCKPVVLNRDNPRVSGKDFWNYIYVDRIKAIEYLHCKGYNLGYLKKSLNFKVIDTIFIAIIAKHGNTKAVVFNKFIKTDRFIPIHIKLLILIMDRLPQQVVAKAAIVINYLR